jgi:hypothetical protein
VGDQTGEESGVERRMTVPVYVGMDLPVQAVCDLLASPAMADWFITIANDRADGIPLFDAFEKVYDREVDPETVGERFFAIVTAPRGDRDNPYGSTSTTTDDITQRITIGVVLQGDDPSLMTKQVQRAIAAVRENIRANLATLIPYSMRAGDVRLGNEDYEPLALIPGDNNILMKAGTIEIGVPMIS